MRCNRKYNIVITWCYLQFDVLSMNISTISCFLFFFLFSMAEMREREMCRSLFNISFCYIIIVTLIGIGWSISIFIRLHNNADEEKKRLRKSVLVFVCMYIYCVVVASMCLICCPFKWFDLLALNSRRRWRWAQDEIETRWWSKIMKKTHINIYVYIDFDPGTHHIIFIMRGDFDTKTDF